MLNVTPEKALNPADDHTMRAVVHRQYGSPDLLALEEVERPTPGDDDVLVRVHAASANSGDHHVVTGRPYMIRLSPYGGVPRPRHRVLGATMAGRVVAVGAKVTTVRPGDEVYGQARSGAFAEYLVMPAAMIARKPTNLSFEEAAAVPWATTALQAFRAGGLKPGQKILINGASGGVGTWAVQLAKALGAEVTAVCSTRNVAMVRGLGADEVIDYRVQDFVTGGARFDVMLDLVGNRSLSDCRRVLVPGGTYVPCSGGGGDWVGPLVRIVAGLATFLFSRRRFKMFVNTPNREDLEVLTALVEAGKARPVIERRYALGEVAEALAHVGAGHTRGQTILRIAS
ncbi:MAG: NAD(P)-dependent alcohol dehydrogenase [Myxococcales bacterium]|nr:NAD(P)-dependent alcohol dehydrogenase [Myxococcales bacterium]